MTKPTLDDIEKLYKHLALPFYQVIRDIPVPITKRRNENSAEHSWCLAMIACALAYEVDPTLDLGKVSMFAVMHDVVEVYAGDTSAFASRKYQATKAHRERVALKKIQQEFSTFPWIAQVITEYERKDSNEARFVYALDKLVNTLIVYVDKNRYNLEVRKATKELFNDKLAGHRQKAHAHPAVAQYYDQLREAFNAHPEWFYSASEEV